MRAFMSSRIQRAWTPAVKPYNYGWDIIDRPAERWNADAAEREARAILAEIEPFREGGEDHDAWPAVWWMLNPDPKRDTGPERVARKALADALRAFVADGGIE